MSAGRVFRSTAMSAQMRPTLNGEYPQGEPPPQGGKEKEVSFQLMHW
jgi:hypothetical protein